MANTNEENQRTCDLCSEPAVFFASPLDNPDEPALCDKHFKQYLKVSSSVTKEGKENG